ncbi:MAG TPA: argininosuccinate synthase [Actinomycetota bacterium]
MLAYSGGLDTTVAVRWLQEKMGLDVIAVAVDVGQGSDLGAVRDRALETGAAEAHVVDARDELASDFLAPALKANALYQQKYPLVSSLSRPVICRHLVAAARRSGARYVAHGCTGKGNDQVRFEVSIRALAPDLEVLAPVREWGMSRDETIEFGLDRSLPITVKKESPYSIDENLWGRAIECGVLEDPMAEPPDDIWDRTCDPVDAPREALVAEVAFEGGLPVAIDGRRLGFAGAIERVEQMAGAYGFGRLDMIEDRVVGIKSREVYEAPGSLALIRAHADLEELTLDREVLRTKHLLEQRWAQLVYEGLWFSPLREAIDAFVEATQRVVAGTVRLRFEPGNVRVIGRSSPHSLYSHGLATYDSSDRFDHLAAEGFVKLWGLPAELWAQVHGGSAARS